MAKLLPFFLVLYVLSCASDISVERVTVEYFAAKHLHHLYPLSLLTKYFSLEYRQDDVVLGPYINFFQYAKVTCNGFSSWECTFRTLCHASKLSVGPVQPSVELTRNAVLKLYAIDVDVNHCVKERLQTLFRQYYPLSPEFMLEDEAMHLFLAFLVYQLSTGMKVTYKTAMMNVGSENAVKKVEMAENTGALLDISQISRDVLILIKYDRQIISQLNVPITIVDFINHIKPFYDELHCTERQEKTWSKIFVKLFIERFPNELARRLTRQKMMFVLDHLNPELLETEWYAFTNSTLKKDVERVIGRFLKIQNLKLNTKYSVYIVFSYLAFYLAPQ